MLKITDLSRKQYLYSGRTCPGGWATLEERRKVTFPISQRQRGISVRWQPRRRKAENGYDDDGEAVPGASRTRLAAHIYTHMCRVRVYVCVILLFLQPWPWGSAAAREQRYYQIGSASFPWGASAKSPGRRSKKLTHIGMAKVRR